MYEYIYIVICIDILFINEFGRVERENDGCNYNYCSKKRKGGESARGGGTRVSVRERGWIESRPTANPWIVISRNLL